MFRVRTGFISRLGGGGATLPPHPPPRALHCRMCPFEFFTAACAPSSSRRRHRRRRRRGLERGLHLRLVPSRSHRRGQPLPQLHRRPSRPSFQRRRRRPPPGSGAWPAPSPGATAFPPPGTTASKTGATPPATTQRALRRRCTREKAGGSLVRGRGGVQGRDAARQRRGGVSRAKRVVKRSV